MGPGSKNGGEITFEGTYNELLSSNTSTGNALRHKHNLKENIREANHFYNIGPVTQNNLNNVKTSIPKHVLTVLTGVAGSGRVPLLKAGFENNDHTIIKSSSRINRSIC